MRKNPLKNDKYYNLLVKERSRRDLAKGECALGRLCHHSSPAGSEVGVSGSDSELVDFNIRTQNYGIALNLAHPLTQQLDKRLLSVEMQMKFQKMIDNWFQFDTKTKN